jgi:hypothetical protein
MVRPSAYRLFWLLLLAGWALGLLALAGVEESLAIPGGALLTAAGLLLLADGGRTMAALNERYARSPGASHLLMGPLLIAIGALWVVYGVAA